MPHSYVTLDEFASMLGTSSTSNLIVEFAEEALETASRDVDSYCGRRFYMETAVSPASSETRTFQSVSPTQVFIDDAYEVTVVAIDSAADGTYATTWAAAGYVLGRVPIDGVALADRPYGSVLSTPGYVFPGGLRGADVKITGRWGWAAVPSPVKSACRRLAHLQYEARNAAFGAAGTAETGYIRLRDDVLACQWLNPFVKNSPKFLVA